jgi:broad-specificity NMP kinase
MFSHKKKGKVLLTKRIKERGVRKEKRRENVKAFKF